MNREKWLCNGLMKMMLNSSNDPIFGFYTKYQKFDAWKGIHTDEIFILTLAEVFLHENS